MSSARRWSVSLVFSLVLNLLALCALGDFWRVPPQTRARTPQTPRIAVYTPPKPAPPTPDALPPTPVTPPEPYDITAQPPVIPDAPSLPPTPLSAFSSAPLPLAPMPVTAPLPLAPAPDASAPAPQPAVAAQTVMPATPSVTPERSMLTTQRPDAPDLAPQSTEPSSDSLTEPTLAPASGNGAEPGTSNSEKGDGKGDGDGKTGDGGTGDGKGGRGGGDGRGPFGIKTGGGGNGPRRVVYLLDVSLSMRSRIARARAELHAALTNLQSGDSFDIVAFSGRVQTFDSALVPVSDATIAQADYFLTTLSLRTGTNLEDGLTRALSVPDVNTVIVLTDGEPTEGETDTKKLTKIIKAANRNDAKIYAIGLVGKDLDGGDNTFEATQLLYEITDQNGGDLHTYTIGVQTP